MGRGPIEGGIVIAKDLSVVGRGRDDTTVAGPPIRKITTFRIEGAADRLFGGPGSDDLFGGPGFDSLFGEAGDDSLTDVEGGRIDGGFGFDRCIGKGSVDVIDCEKINPEKTPF